MPGKSRTAAIAGRRSVRFGIRLELEADSELHLALFGEGAIGRVRQTEG
jgi:hypothetical protein